MFGKKKQHKPASSLWGPSFTWDMTNDDIAREIARWQNRLEEISTPAPEEIYSNKCNFWLWVKRHVGL
jgi:hypothetical protein